MITLVSAFIKQFGFKKNSNFLPSVIMVATLLLVSGCAEYAMKKDLDDLRLKEGQKDNEIYERIEKVEQAPKADSAVMSALAERVERMEKYIKEIEGKKELEGKKEQAQPSMSLDIKKVEVEYKDIDVLSKKLEDLDSRLKSINAIKKVELKHVQFPLGKVMVSDLSRREQAKLLENAERIKEEMPSRVAITTWSDSLGSPERREKVSSERAKNIVAFYRKKIGEGLNIDFRSISKVATIPGTFWRRADTSMWMSQE